MDIKQFKPQNIKRSDKYSANLYKFLRKNKHWGINAYSPQLDWNMNFAPFDYEDPRPRSIYIGFRDDHGWLCGRSLADIIGSGRGCLESYAYAPGKDGAFYKNMIDITDWFFSAYREQGRALWDVKGQMSMLGDESRWTYVGNTKRCNWSGRWYDREIVKKQITKRSEIWVPQ